MAKQKTELLPFGDEAFLQYDGATIDCSRLGYFDALEYDCWKLINAYAEHFGLSLVYEDGEEAGISFDVAKELQEKILEMFEAVGVKFKFI